MTNKLLYIFFLLVNINFTFGQSTYDLFTIKGLKYGILYVDSYENDKISNHSSFYEGDTVINGIPLIRHARYTFTFLKNYLHIDGNKVYFFEQGTKSLILLYDFSLQVNDAFIDGQGNNYIVQKREIKTYGDGKARIYLQLKSQFNNTTEEWIEGIGDINIGPFNFNYFHRYDLRFVCLSDEDGLIFSNEESTHICNDSLFCKNAIAKFSTSAGALKVEFQNNSLNSIAQIWDFGDGNISTALNPTHQFDSPGCKEVTLKAISTCGDTSIISSSINYCIKGDWQKNMYLDIENSLSDVNFIDEQRLSVTTNQSILYSQNGGITFNNITPNIDPKKVIQKLFFDGQKGVVFVQSRAINKGYFEIFYTSDGGENWTLSKEGFGEQGYLYHNYKTNTFIFRAISSNIGYALISKDDGKNWSDMPLPGFNINAQFNILDNASLVFKYQNNINNQKQDFLALSKDFGTTWDINPTLGYQASFFTNENLSYFVSNDKEFLISNDLLKTYKTLYQFPSDFHPYQLYFLDENLGFTLDYRYSFYTLDGGKTWMESNCEQNDFEEIGVDQNNEIFAFGRNNNIYRFSPPEVDEQCLSSSPADNDFSVNNFFVFPNPILEGNSIEIGNISGTGAYFVDIFNAYGAQLLHQQPIDNTINTSQLPKGIYIVSIKDKSLLILKTMTLVII